MTMMWMTTKKLLQPNSRSQIVLEENAKQKEQHKNLMNNLCCEKKVIMNVRFDVHFETIFYTFLHSTKTTTTHQAVKQNENEKDEKRGGANEPRIYRKNQFMSFFHVFWILLIFNCIDDHLNNLHQLIRIQYVWWRWRPVCWCCCSEDEWDLFDWYGLIFNKNIFLNLNNFMAI